MTDDTEKPRTNPKRPVRSKKNTAIKDKVSNKITDQHRNIKEAAKVGDTGLTPKEYRFCQLYVQLDCATEAYRAAYDIPTAKSKIVSEGARRVLKRIKVQEFIGVLRAMALDEHLVTVTEIDRQLIQDRAFARANGNASAAVAATIARMRLYGMDKQNVSVDNPAESGVMVYIPHNKRDDPKDADFELVEGIPDSGDNPISGGSNQND